MPAVRLSRRRRSSIGLSLQSKAAIARPVTFAPNVTPISYSVPEEDSELSFPDPNVLQPALFPPSDAPTPPPTRRRVPPGKRRSLGYIPRPPNAFMLFRADFVRQKHVPGSIETNHGSLSKIIGNCWRALPLEERRIWEVKAKHAKAQHKAQYPEYRFRPVHNKNKDKKKERPVISAAEERRCEDVAALLLEGKKGEELAEAVRELDGRRPRTPVPQPNSHRHRRSSSVPLSNDYYAAGITLPSVPFLSAHSRPVSPARMMFGSRRASSAGARPIPGLSRSWTMPMPSTLQRDHSPLPEVDTSLFEPAFLDPTGAHYFQTQNNHVNDTNAMYSNEVLHLQQHNSLSPLDVSLVSSSSYAPSPATTLSVESIGWLEGSSPNQYDIAYEPSSHASSAYSGSPVLAPETLPMQGLSLDPSVVPILAPQPVHHTDETVFSDLWKGLTEGRSFAIDAAVDHHHHHHDLSQFGYDTVKNSPQDIIYEQVLDTGYEQYGMIPMHS